MLSSNSVSYFLIQQREAEGKSALHDEKKIIQLIKMDVWWCLLESDCWYQLFVLEFFYTYMKNTNGTCFVEWDSWDFNISQLFPALFSPSLLLFLFSTTWIWYVPQSADILTKKRSHNSVFSHSFSDKFPPVN